MFNNIGSKIKALAKVVTWVGIIGSVIAGIGMMTASRTMIGAYGIDVRGGSVIGGILVMVVGSVAAWVSSFILYGFGDLVENAKRIADAQERRP